MARVSSTENMYGQMWLHRVLYWTCSNMKLPPVVSSSVCNTWLACVFLHVWPNILLDVLYMDMSQRTYVNIPCTLDIFWRAQISRGPRWRGVQFCTTKHNSPRKKERTFKHTKHAQTNARKTRVSRILIKARKKQGGEGAAVFNDTCCSYRYAPTQ